MKKHSWRADASLYSMSLFRRDLHQVMAAARGITQAELSAEMGVSKEAVSQYMRDGSTEEVADRMDRAITAISDRRGLGPSRAVWPVSGLQPDGLPETVAVNAVEELYRNELVIRDLMKAPGRDV